MRGNYDKELARLTPQSLKDQLPNGLHTTYTKHKKEAEKWVSLIKAAKLNREKMAAIMRQKKEEAEKKKLEQENERRVAAFKLAMKAIANNLGVDWTQLTSQPFTQALLKELNELARGGPVEG